MYKYAKKILAENKILFIGILLLMLSLITIISASYSEYKDVREILRIDLSNTLLATMSDLLNEKSVAETINGSMVIINNCSRTLHIVLYYKDNYNEYHVSPNSRYILDNISLNNLIRIDQVPKCIVTLEIDIRYIRYPLAYLNFLAFILVATGSIMIIRYMLRKTREIQET